MSEDLMLVSEAVNRGLSYEEAVALGPVPGADGRMQLGVKEVSGALAVHAPRPCEVCGREFVPRDRRNATCSPKCGKAWDRLRRQLERRRKRYG